MSTPTLFQYPFTPKTLRIQGHALSYLDEGRGLPLVMVHGNPSWSYLYRNLVRELRRRHRCIAPDHMGCGLSAKPANYPYRLRRHIDNLEHLLDHLKVERCVLMVHDWGGAIGMGWAIRHPERINGLVVFNTAAFPADQIPLRINICRLPLLGALMIRGFNGFARAAVHMAVRRKMSPRVAAGFLYPYDSWKNRVALHAFVRDIPMKKNHPSRLTLEEVADGLHRLRDKPMLICWGGDDFCFTDSFLNQWQQRFPAAESHYLARAGHYVLEDALPEILHHLHPFLAACHD